MYYSIETWFERDRAMVRLIEHGNDGLVDYDKEVFCFWDNNVNELVEDGFLNPKDWLQSAFEYAQYIGLIKQSSAQKALYKVNTQKEVIR